MTIGLINRKWVATELQANATSALCLALSSGIPIALYGAGQTGRLVAKNLQGTTGIFFIDDTADKLGKVIEGIPVLSVNQAFEIYGQSLFVIVCIFSAKHQYSKTKKSLEERFHWQVCTFSQALFLKSTDLPYLYLDDISRQSLLQKKYIEIFNNLADQRSKDVLIEHLHARLLADFSGGVDLRAELSFLVLAPDAKVSFVDCGAYDGDTVQEFIDWRGEKFGRIFALEPDPVNFNKLTERISGLPSTFKSRIELCQAATWYSVGKMPFLSTQSVGSTISDYGDNLVITMTLDSFWALPKPLIIKLDVEGAEWETVSGSLEFIRARQPILAISVYHKPNDLVDLFDLINSLNVGYIFFLRCHGGDGTDLTLYCSPSTSNVDGLPVKDLKLHTESNYDLSKLTFDDFRKLAGDSTLSRHIKVGFPDSYREGRENSIFLDIQAKLYSLRKKSGVVLEIGPGCSLLPVILSSQCRNNDQKLIFIDSQEMLSLLPDAGFIEKIPGCFPHVDGVFDKYKNTLNTIIAYSVIQYVFAEANLWDFIDRALSLLADGGEILLGDIPNMTMRKRFFTSAAGVKCHREFTGRDELPNVRFNELEPSQIDDSVVYSILMRVRAQGFHAWVLPQSLNLPMANRREDILIRKP